EGCGDEAGQDDGPEEKGARDAVDDDLVHSGFGVLAREQVCEQAETGYEPQEKAAEFPDAAPDGRRRRGVHPRRNVRRGRRCLDGGRQLVLQCHWNLAFGIKGISYAVPETAATL